MGQHVVVIQNEIEGLHIKGEGTFAAGSRWSVETVPEKIITKIKAGETALNVKGKTVPICSFITAEGHSVALKDAYIPKFNIGKPPPQVKEQVKEYEVSKKSRVVDVEAVVEENDEDEEKIEAASDDAELEGTEYETETVVAEDKPKKKKIKKATK